MLNSLWIFATVLCWQLVYMMRREWILEYTNYEQHNFSVYDIVILLLSSLIILQRQRRFLLSLCKISTSFFLLLALMNLALITSSQKFHNTFNPWSPFERFSKSLKYLTGIWGIFEDSSFHSCKQNIQWSYSSQPSSYLVGENLEQDLTVGNVSFELCPLLTWSLGCTTDLSPSFPPRISIALFAMTSFAFILLWVPLPVCHTTKGKWSCNFPSETSFAADWIAFPIFESNTPRSIFTYIKGISRHFHFRYLHKVWVWDLMKWSKSSTCDSNQSPGIVLNVMGGI